MDPDLCDLLMAWQGEDLADARQAELLERLRQDEAFRHAFVAEIRLLGMLKAVQSTEPRWLLLEDELGWGAEERATRASLEDQVMKRIQNLPPPRSRPWLWWGAMNVPVVLLTGLLVFWLLRPSPRPSPPLAPSHVAVVVRLDGAQWEGGEQPQPSEGSALPSGPLHLRAGRVTMTLFSGVMLSLQAPAELNLLSVERVFCRQGKLRVRVPPGAEGFTVLTPGSAVVDLGTEFGLNVAADGTAQLLVFRGMAEVSVLNREGSTLQSQLVQEERAAEIDPSVRRIRAIAATPDQFVAAPELIPPALALDPAYPEQVRRLRPWGYWRFETLTGQLIPNEVADRPPLRAIGPLKLAGTPGANQSILFGPTEAEQCLVMDEPWTLRRETGSAVELWVLSEQYTASTLVSLFDFDAKPKDLHLFLLELTGLSHHLLHDPCRARYLDRWPPGSSGGVNVFSRNVYIPYRWHHLVAQKILDRLELYLDGELAGTAQADPAEETTLCRLLVGRLRRGHQKDIYQIRPFVGRLDELALYERPLHPEEIRRHYQLGAAGKALPP